MVRPSIMDVMIKNVASTVNEFTITQQTIQALLGETRTLVQAAQAGELAQRADARRYEGDWAPGVSSA